MAEPSGRPTTVAVSAAPQDQPAAIKNEAVSTPASTNYQQPSYSPQYPGYPQDHYVMQAMQPPPAYGTTTQSVTQIQPYPNAGAYGVSTIVTNGGQMMLPQYNASEMMMVVAMKQRATIMAVISFICGSAYCCCLSIPALVCACRDPMLPDARKKYRTSMILSGIVIGFGILGVVAAVIYAIVRATLLVTTYSSTDCTSWTSSYCRSYVISNPASYSYSAQYQTCCTYYG